VASLSTFVGLTALTVGTISYWEGASSARTAQERVPVVIDAEPPPITVESDSRRSHENGGERNAVAGMLVLFVFFERNVKCSIYNSCDIVMGM
jgi:hypothetical protein